MQNLKSEKSTLIIFTITLFLVSMVLSVMSVLTLAPKFELRVLVKASMGGIINIWSDWFEEPTSLDVNDQFNSYETKMLSKHLLNIN